MCYNGIINRMRGDGAMKNLFAPESGLMVTMGKITDAVFLSLFWLLGCFPVVTVGASCAAVYDASFRGFRKGERNPWKRFWQVFLRNWKTAIVPTLLFLLALGGLVLGTVRLWNGAVAGTVSWMTFSAVALLAVVCLGILSVMFPMVSRFENGIGALLRNTLLLSLANLPRVLALGVLMAGVGVICVRFLIPVFFLPGLAALISSWLIEPMFRPYMKEE